MRWIKALLFFAGFVYVCICFALYAGQDYLLFHPHKLSKDYQFKFNVNDSIEEIYVKGLDNADINTVLFKAKNPRGIIIYYHGNTGNNQMCGWHYSDFVPRGYHFLVWDYRSYGKSEGRLTEAALLNDGVSVYDFVKKKYPKLPITLYGHSMGTGIATYVTSKRQPRQLILSAPYYSIEDLATRNYSFVPKFLVKFPLRTHQFIQSVKCSITMFHGTKDEVIYWQSSEMLHKLNSKSNFIKLPGVGHNDISEALIFQSTLDSLVGPIL